jgi:hypothetical protein
MKDNESNSDPRHPVVARYTEGIYLKENTDWHSEDSAWKASLFLSVLNKADIKDCSQIIEIGCGKGGILDELSKLLPGCNFIGFDISPNLEPFWRKIINNNKKIQFFNSSLNKDTLSQENSIVILADVLEHLVDPWSLLDSVSSAKYLLIHFPLDLSSLSVARFGRLRETRRKVGHIHYFSKELALELCKEANLEVLDVQYTGACFYAENGLKKIFGFIRLLLMRLLGDFGVRVLGGETLLVLARPKTKEMSN